MRVEIHQLPSFSYDTERTCWVLFEPTLTTDAPDIFGADKKKVEKADAKLYDTLAQDELPVPCYQIGDIVHFAWNDGPLHGPIVAIRLVGQAYSIEWGENGQRVLEPTQRHSQSFWMATCYSLDSIVYHVKMQGYTPRVQGRFISKCEKSEKYQSLSVQQQEEEFLASVF